MRPNQGACRCPSVAHSTEVRRLDCTCIWDEVLSAVQHLAYGQPSDDDIVALAPVLATLAHDAAYRARNEALERILKDWPGTRTEFASTFGLSRSGLYKILS